MLSRLSCSLIGAAMAIDGDTLQILPAPAGQPENCRSCEDVQVGCLVRLWGASAPELRHDGGPEALDAMRAIVAGQLVDCRETHGWSFERRVARCVLSDGTDIAAELVRLGWATDTPDYSAGHYAPAEAEARRHGRGMWGGD